MNANYKGRLQEYCQRRHLPMPKYRLLKTSGLSHSPKFQVEVQIGRERFTGNSFCSRKKEAEQSAAHVAYYALKSTTRKRALPQSFSRQTTLHNPHQHLTPESSMLAWRSSLSTNNSMKHMPSQYSSSEQAIIDIISSDGGRIRKIWAADEQGRYQFEITGTYRYCENVRRHHKKNHIYFIVDPIRKTYYQKCHDPKCFGFQSAIKVFSTNEYQLSVKRKSILSTRDSTSVKHLKYETD